MRRAGGQGNRKAGVALQLAAMVMLLSAPYWPVLARALDLHARPGQCAMDHRLCGCSPERIASRTCCCFKNGMRAEPSGAPGHADLEANAHGQCPLHDAGVHRQGDLQEAKAHEERNLLKDNASPSSPVLSCLPCGRSPETILHTAADLKYLSSARAPLAALGATSHHLPQRDDGYLNPSLEPPVPPPKISF